MESGEVAERGPRSGEAVEMVEMGSQVERGAEAERTPVRGDWLLGPMTPSTLRTPMKSSTPRSPMAAMTSLRE